MSALMEVPVESTAESAQTKILSWVFDKFVGGAISQAGGFGMDQILFLIGLKEDPQVVGRLEKIQEGINDILREVAAIRNQLDTLMKQLSLSVKEILISIGESAINASRAVIDTHYGTADALLTDAPTPAKATSLGEAVRLRLKSQDVDTKWFAENVLGTWDIQSHVVKIAQIAGKKTDFVSKPLLAGWTDYLLESNRGSVRSRALTMYLTLESFFQQLLEIQFKGIGLVAMAKCYDKTEAQAKPITEAFLADIAPHITAQADLFVQCADEIILAMFTETPRWVYSPGPTKADKVIATISQRANLIRSVVYSAVGKGSASGIHGTVIGRNVENENAVTRTYAPQGFTASAGSAIGPLDAGAGNVPIEWEPSTDKRYGVLRPKSKSGFWAFHYTWPWNATEPEAGKPIDPSFDGGLTPRWYSLDTLEPVDKRGDATVLVADFCEMRFMRGAVFADPAFADAALFSVPVTGATNVNQNRSGERIGESHGVHAMRADETYNRLLASGTLEARMNYNNPQGGPVGFSLEFPLLRYKGPSSTVQLALDLKFVQELVENVYPTGYERSTMRMTPHGKIALYRYRDGKLTTIPLYDTYDEPMWGKPSPVTTTEAKQFAADVTLEDTGTTDDLYSLVLAFQVLNDLDYWSPASDAYRAKGRITYELHGFRMQWK